MSNDVADWELVVRVRLRNAFDVIDPRDHSSIENAKKCLLDVIEEEGGIYQALLDWCDDEDFELVSLTPIESNKES